MRVELTQEVDTCGGRVYAHPGSPCVVDVPPAEARRLVEIGVGRIVDPIAEAPVAPRRREIDRMLRSGVSR